MTIFLTSSHTVGWAGPLNRANGFDIELYKALSGRPLRAVMVSSFPDDREITDRMAWEIRECFDDAGMSFDSYEVLDRRTARHARRIIRNATFIVLCGGHVPTENAFFAEINLRELLESFDGVMLTISAGSMNCAERVFSPPEREGETSDPEYNWYLPGLGLTDINILPHFRGLRRTKVDGHPLIRDLIMPHSFDHPVYCLPDGSYFIITSDETLLCGEAWKISKGRIRKVCLDGERRRLTLSGRLVKI